MAIEGVSLRMGLMNKLKAEKDKKKKNCIKSSFKVNH